MVKFHEGASFRVGQISKRLPEGVAVATGEAAEAVENACCFVSFLDQLI